MVWEYKTIENEKKYINMQIEKVFTLFEYYIITYFVLGYSSYFLLHCKSECYNNVKCF